LETVDLDPDENENNFEADSDDDDYSGFVPSKNCVSERYTVEDIDHDFENYAIEDFIGTYRYMSCFQSHCGGEEVIWTLKLKKDGKFVLDCPSTCGGGHDIRGKFDFDEEGLTIDPTHFINYAGRNSEKDDEKLKANSPWKKVTLDIIDKKTLILSIFNQSEYDVDQVVLKKIK